MTRTLIAMIGLLLGASAARAEITQKRVIDDHRNGKVVSRSKSTYWNRKNGTDTPTRMVRRLRYVMQRVDGKDVPVLDMTQTLSERKNADGTTKYVTTNRRPRGTFNKLVSVERMNDDGSRNVTQTLVARFDGSFDRSKVTAKITGQTPTDIVGTVVETYDNGRVTTKQATAGHVGVYMRSLDPAVHN